MHILWCMSMCSAIGMQCSSLYLAVSACVQEATLNINLWPAGLTLADVTTDHSAFLDNAGMQRSTNCVFSTCTQLHGGDAQGKPCTATAVCICMP